MTVRIKFYSLWKNIHIQSYSRDSHKCHVKLSIHLFLIRVSFSIHKLVKMVYTCYTSSCLRSIIVEYQYGQEASRQNIAMTHAS